MLAEAVPLLQQRPVAMEAPMRSLTTAGLLALSLTGCDLSKDTGDGQDCTTIAIVSAQVVLLDDSGAAIEGADVTVTDDSGNTQDCEESSGQYLCGWEMTGDLTISAEADGYQPGSTAVTVASDGCHPITEDVTLTLSPADK